MNRDIDCQVCGEPREIVGYRRDDPILSCGHVKKCDGTEEKKTKLREETRKIIEEDAENTGRTVEQVRTDYIQQLLDVFAPDEDDETTVGYCEVCGTVTVIEDENGTPRCCGNLLDNPGCGMPVQQEQTYGI